MQRSITSPRLFNRVTTIGRFQVIDDYDDLDETVIEEKRINTPLSQSPSPPITPKASQTPELRVSPGAGLSESSVEESPGAVSLKTCMSIGSGPVASGSEITAQRELTATPEVQCEFVELTFQELENMVKSNNIDLLDAYLKNDPTILDKNWNGFTIAHVIASCGCDAKMVQCLEQHLIKNKKLDMLFAEGLYSWIPLHYAAYFNNAQIVLAFLAMLDQKRQYDAVTWVNRTLLDNKNTCNAFELAKQNQNFSAEVTNALKPYAFFNTIKQRPKPLEIKEIEKDFPEAKENKELTKFLNYGYRVANDVYALGTVAATDPEFNDLPPELFQERDNLIGEMRAEYDVQAEKIKTQYPDRVTQIDKLLELNYNLVMEYKSANCMELAYLCLKRLREIDPTVRGEVVYIANDDHWFCVIGRPMNSDLKDYKTWGNAVVVDVFGKAKNVFPAKQIPDRLSYYYREITFGRNVVGRVHRDIHYYGREIAFDPEPPTLPADTTTLYRHSC